MTKNGKSLTIACGRALTARDNVVIDTSGCRRDPGDLAVKVANQIAGKVDSANTNLLATSLSKGYGLNNCQPTAMDKLTGLALAEFVCGLSPDPSGPVSAIYRLLPDTDGLGSDFKSITQDMIMTPCSPEAAQSPGTWQQGQTGGQRACGTQKNVATITWTTDGKNVLGSIRSSNSDTSALHQ
ncbi:serine/threonine protein kinase [Mycobacterium sp. ML4]